MRFFILFYLFADNFFLLLNIPKIAHIASRKELFRLYQRKQTFPEQECRQAGSRLIEEGLLAQKFVLIPVPNSIEKFFVQEGAGDHVGSLMKYHVILEQETEDVLKQGAEMRQERAAGLFEFPKRRGFRPEISVYPAVVGIVFDPAGALGQRLGNSFARRFLPVFRRHQNCSNISF